MTCVGITADIHFGVPGRTDDILWACRVMREYCAEHEIDVMFVLGDLYHNRQAIEIDVNSQVARFFEETKEKYGQNWIVFPGNHDMFLRHSWGVNSLTPLKKHLTVIEDVKLLDIDNQQFWILPFITYEKAYMRVVRAIMEHEKYRPNEDILLTHIGVRSATLNTCFLLKDWSSVTFEYSTFKRVYTGHFHSKQQVGENVWYPGSPIPFKFDEGDVPHGFYVYDIEASNHKFVNIWKAGSRYFPDVPQPPQFTTISDESVKSADVSGAMVRIALDRDFTNDEKAVLKQELLKRGAKDVRLMEMKPKKEPDAEKILEGPSPALHHNLFMVWVERDSKNIKDLDIAILNRCNDEVMHEGDELYVIESSEF
jgi:DNA repair exonuclease SbcCD nuclease subunit